MGSTNTKYTTAATIANVRIEPSTAPSFTSAVWPSRSGC